MLCSSHLETTFIPSLQRIEDFFSNAITHLITNHTVPTTFTVDIAADKENVPKSKASLSRPAALLRSPIKLKGR